jgi:UDP-glucose 4-epimerase
MASRGSVIPLFMEQIKLNKPLTVTNPDMTRFMMTLEDAVNLVLFAFQNGEQGDIFVQKSPASTIGDLALAMKELYNSESELKVIGTRHGEKLYETLVSQEEMVKTIDMGNYFKILADNRDLNYEQYFEKGNELVSKIVEYHSHNTTRLAGQNLKNLLLKLEIIQNDLKNNTVL